MNKRLIAWVAAYCLFVAGLPCWIFYCERVMPPVRKNRVIISDEGEYAVQRFYGSWWGTLITYATKQEAIRTRDEWIARDEKERHDRSIKWRVVE